MTADGNRTQTQRKSPYVVGGAMAVVAVLVSAAFHTAPRSRYGEVSAQGAGQWTAPGAAPFSVANGPSTYYESGRIASIAADPRDPQRWLVGVGNGGVWDTHDGGRTFAPITDDAPTLATGAVAFAPGSPDVIYVGTGETGGSTAVARVGVGILKSIDNGQSWSLLGQSTFTRAAIRRLRVDPNDANVVLAASQRSAFGRDSLLGAPLPPPFGVFRSTDGGNNWTRTLAGQATALEVDPTSFARQYAAIADQRLGDFSDSHSANGVYRSTDGGVNWSRIDGPWGSDTNAAQSSGGRIELAIAPSNPSIMYASVQKPLSEGGSTSNDLLGLFRTDNAWADPPTWIQIPTDRVTNENGSGYCPTKCGYSHVIAVDPHDANTLIAGGERDLWRCTTCGASPTWKATARTHADFHEVTWAGNRLIAGNDGGVWSSTDNGTTWQSHNQGLPTNMFYMGALHPTDSTVSLGGARDYPVALLRAGVWQVLRQAATAEWGEGEVAISSAHPNTDWMGTHTAAIVQRTLDGANTVVQVDAGIDRTGAAFIAPVRKCPANDDVFLAGTIRLWRTDNFFNSSMPSWAPQTPPRPYPTPGPNPLNEPGAILSITFVADGACTTYAYGTRGGDVRLTRDGGATWTDLDPSKSLPARPVNALAFVPSNSNRMFAVVSSYDEVTPSRPGHIFRTDNALASSPTWTRVGPPDVPFANVPFDAVAVDPRNTNLVYAGSENGLWQSVDGGTTFTKVGLESGLPPVTVNDIQINPQTNQTVIFTYGRGAYRLNAAP